MIDPRQPRSPALYLGLLILTVVVVAVCFLVSELRAVPLFFA